MSTYDVLRLRVDRKDDGSLYGTAEGQAADFVQPLVNQFIGTLNRLKVIAQKDGGNVYNLYNPPQPSEAGLRALTRKLKDILYGHVFPAVANIAVTDACQCRCVHCSAELFRGTGEEKALTTAELKCVVDDALSLGANLIVFTGGEPLLQRDIVDLVAHVDKSKAAVMMFTNGLGLTEDMVDRLAGAGVFSLNISLDGPKAEVHDGLRKVDGCFERALEGAARARAAGILTGISTYATSENLASGDLEALIQLGQREGFHEVTIFDCIPSGRFLRQMELCLSRKEKQAIVDLGDRVHRSDHPMGVVTMARVNSPDGAGCFGGYTQLYVSAQGQVNPCDFNPISFGSVRDYPLEAIWERMVSHPEYGERQQTCRMQSKRYRSRFIDPIPEGTALPVSIDRLPGDGTYNKES